MTTEQHIEELRTEARNAPTLEERRQIEAELNAATEQLIAEIENLSRGHSHLVTSVVLPAPPLLLTAA
jgi:hypothetical protein